MKKKPETGQWFFEPNEEDEELARDIRYIYTLLADGGYFKTRWGKRQYEPHIIADAITVVACKPLADLQYEPLFQNLLRKLEQDVKVNEVISHINAELSSLSYADRDSIWGALTDFLEDLISGKVKIVPSTDPTNA